MWNEMFDDVFVAVAWRQRTLWAICDARVRSKNGNNILLSSQHEWFWMLEFKHAIWNFKLRCFGHKQWNYDLSKWFNGKIAFERIKTQFLWTNKSFQIDRDGDLWIFTNRLPIFVYSQLNPNEYNFRLLHVSARDIVRNSTCSNPQRGW